jgi:hypothetical protein
MHRVEGARRVAGPSRVGVPGLKPRPTTELVSSHAAIPSRRLKPARYQNADIRRRGCLLRALPEGRVRQERHAGRRLQAEG